MKLFYRKLGKGPCLFILHGLYGMSDNWMTMGKKLAETFEVYLIDQRNHGQSPHSDNHSYYALRNDLLELINDLSIDAIHLIGHSMGGKTAMLFASDYPERVKSLIAVDISPKHYGSHPGFERNLAMHKGMIAAIKELDLSEFTKLSQVDEKLKNTIPDKFTRQFMLKNISRTQGKMLTWKFNIKTLNKEINSILEGIDEKKYMPGFSSFPTLFIRGEKSNYIMDEDLPLIQKVFPGAQVDTIPNAGHMVHVEQPVLFLESVKRFLLANK